MLACSGSVITIITLALVGGPAGSGPEGAGLPGEVERIRHTTGPNSTYSGQPAPTWWLNECSLPTTSPGHLAGGELPDAPLAVCFAPGTPQEIIDAVNRAVHVAPGPLAYFLDGRWRPFVQGSPTTLSWSFVPDGLTIGSAGSWDNNGNSGPSDLFSRMGSLFGSSIWIEKVEACFARWEELTGVSYVRVTYQGTPWDDGAMWGTAGDIDQELRGDIRIAMRNIDGSSGGILAYNFFPSHGDMMIDRWGNWASSANDYRFLRNVVMHEHGHGLGLYHVCSTNTGQLLEPYINTSFDGPQHDDLRAGQRQYGDPFEEDNSPAEATYLGTVSMETPLTAGAVPDPAIPHSGLLSIDGNDEEDWFRFTATAAQTLATVAVTPKGYHYDSSPEESSGCTCCNYIDSDLMADLNVQIVDTDGSTVLGTGDSAPTGMTETLSDVVLPAPGDYYVRVYEGDAPSESQLYELELSIILPGACCLADGDCTVMSDMECVLVPGDYVGHGTECPPDPPCQPVPTVMTCSPSTLVASPGTGIPLDLLLTEVEDLGTYQGTITITRTAGEGTLTVNCPDGVQVDQTRPDFIFTGLSVVAGAACEYLQVGAVALSGSATVGGEWKYLGDFTLDVSADATPGTTFEIAIVPDRSATFLRNSMAEGLMVRFGMPCTLTVVGETMNRYVSFSPDPAELLAYQVELTDSAYFPESTGVLGWVGEPFEAPDDPGIWIARVVDTAFYADDWPSVVQVGDCPIVPAATYLIRSTPDGISFVDLPLKPTIARPNPPKEWADVVGEFNGTEWTRPNREVNMDDVMASVQKFQRLETAPPLSWVDVDPEAPNAVLNFTDIFQIVQGFKGEPYPFSDPADCP